MFTGVTLTAVLPHLGVVLVAFSRDWYGTILPAGWTLGNFRLALGHELTVPAIANSLKFAAAATLLGIGRTTLYRKMKEYNLGVDSRARHDV